MMKKLNVKSGAALLLAVVMLLGMLTGCADTPSDAPNTSNDLTGCTVEVKTAGGKALEGVGVYVYKDAAMTDMIDYVKTNDKGIAAISSSVPAGGVAVLDKVPEGYAAQESYAITTVDTKIVLPIQLRQQIGKIALGDVMFDFTVTDTNGTAHTLSELLQTKKAVVLNLWYVNCDPCKAEFPYLNEAYDKYANDIEILAINPEGDSEAAIADFVTEHALRFPTAKADAAWKDTIATLAYPTTVIIDRFGTVGLIHTGGIDSAKVFEDAFAYFVADGYVQTTVERITDVATQDDPAPTTDPTESTQAPTESTQPTDAPTQAPTDPTQGSTEPVKPTQAPTQAPTQKPTQAPTQKPTEPIESSDTILKGTAVIDGKVDDAYLSSYCVVVDYTMPFNVPVASPDKIQAKTYFLHDGEHLYVVAEVTGDSAVVDTGLISWVSDSVEVWFSNPAGMSSKIVMDAYATPWPHNATNDRENKMKIDLNQVELAVVRNDNGYTVEMKTDIPYYRKSEGTVAINVQLNNVYAADSDASNWDARNGGCFGTQPAKHQPIVVELSE